jgi:1-acylglycerone phosphate reductase
MATDVYAKQVVAQTLKRHAKAWFWTGNFSFTCWLVDTFLGRRAFVRERSWPEYTVKSDF